MRRWVARAAWLAMPVGLGLVATLHSQIRRREDRSAPPSGRRPAVSLSAGPSAYDLGGTGTGFAGALRVDLPWGRKFLIEPGLGVFRYPTQTGSRITYLLPELSFQFSPLRGPARPYAGAGLGLAEFVSGPSGGRGTVHAVTGLRLMVAGRLGLRAEGRLRIYDPLGSTGRMLDLTAGGSWSVGRRE